jgi:hypothetical protein
VAEDYQEAEQKFGAFRVRTSKCAYFSQLKLFILVHRVEVAVSTDDNTVTTAMFA